ncbi:MAG: TIM-barrel domain-containing protein [Salinimicrobium sp.]
MNLKDNMFSSGVKKVIFLSLLFLQFSLFAQNPNRIFEQVQKGENSTELFTNDGKYIFTYYTPEIVETTFVPSGETNSSASYAVVLEPQKVEFELVENDNSVMLDSKGVDILVTKKPFQISYFYDGKEVTSEKTGYSSDEQHEKVDFNLNETEVLFGGGARALGMNRRGNKLELYNRAHYGYTTKSELLNYTLPIVLSSEKYLLHFDNAPIGNLDLDSEHNNTLTYETISGNKRYQLVVGDTWEDLISNYTLLTGRQPLPPRWALGNFSSRFGYHSQKEVENTIDKFREEKIPVDAVILDLFWFGHEIMGTMGNLAFVRDSFPQPKKMMKDLKEKGVKTILVTEPFILTSSNRWEEAVKNDVLAKDSLQQPYTFDFYFGNTGLIDIFEPGAQKWFWNIYEGLAEMGVDGWWGDLGEPEVHPESLQHSIGSANEVHNIYGHYWAKMIYEGYSKNFPEQRPFILMRAGAAGSQRFGLIPWSGDVSRSWGGLKPQPEISLQMGLQGLAYMHSDLGGFAGDLRDDELYARWLQYGVFQPVFRPHAQEEVASEPIFRAAKPKELAKKAIELRYQLLPYNYTLAFRNSVEGLPLMRPLFFEEPENFKLYSVANEYLWGEAFLVSPVVRPGISEKEIYFPKTANWFDFYTGEKHEKGSTANIQLKEEYIPTFVRGGALIPMAKPMQSTSELSPEKVELHYFFDRDSQKSEAILYYDDGKTSAAYKKGLFEILNFSADKKQGNFEITIEKEPGAERKTSEFKKLEVIVHNLEHMPEEVLLNDKKLNYDNIEKGRKLMLLVPLEKNKTTIIFSNTY